MSSHKERFADKMELPPATPQPNIYPLSWNSKTKKLQEVWEASLREAWEPEKLPWDTLDVDSYSWEERESIAYWWTLLSVFDASAPPVFAAAMVALRSLAPTRPAWAGAAAGALAGGAGAAVYALHCPELAAPFLAVWYVAGMGLPVLLGAVLGPRLLRW